MPYIFRGRLCGYLCEDCSEPLGPGIKVRLYRAQGDDVTSQAVAHAKETFAVLDDAAAAARAGSLLAEAETNAEGKFELAISEKQDYSGGPIEVDVYLESVPGQKGDRESTAPLQVSLTTLQPLWRQTEQGAVAVWDHCIPARFWCSVRARFHAWVICGRLTTCTDPTPIAGAKVSACDVDWLQDDPLGSAVTDAGGRFRIDYTTADFRRTPFSPGFNLEWVSGPDVYFEAEYGGVKILDEPRSTGRTAGRENVGPCFCVHLCTDELPVEVPTGPELTPHWQKVEDFNIHPFAPNPASSFSPEGYAGTPNQAYVFGGSVPLRGNCPLRNAAAPANPLEYRFRFGEWAWAGGGDGDAGSLPTVPPATLTTVNDIHPTEVGWVFYNDGVNPFASAPVIITNADFVGGWISVDGKTVTAPMDDGTTMPVTVNPSNFLRSSELMNLDTATISALHPTRLPGGLPPAEAGRVLAPAEQEPIRRYRLRFEVRDAVTLAPVASDTLNAVIFDNSSVILGLNLEELLTNACNPVSNDVHILYTIDHPHLRSFALEISNNNGVVHPSPPLPGQGFAPGNFFFRGGAGGPHQLTGDGGFAVDISGDPPCAYRVKLSWQTRRYQSIPHSTEKLYCK